jgi:galactitol 2-dehydrogenase
MSELDSKRMLVTGSARGIGRAIAELAIQRGARVVVSDLDEAAAAKTAADLGAAGTANCDVTDEAAVQRSVEEAVQILGGLDILVNNAGIEIASPLLQQSTDSFDKIFAVNVRGPFVVLKAAAEHLIASRGNVVNIASIAGIGGSPPPTGLLLRDEGRPDPADPGCGHRDEGRWGARQRGVPGLRRHRHGRPTGA